MLVLEKSQNRNKNKKVILLNLFNAYILHNGQPIYSSKDNLIPTIPENKDVHKDMICGFLQALINFARDAGFGHSLNYTTESTKFSFLNHGNYHFIIASDPESSNNSNSTVLLKLKRKFYETIADFNITEENQAHLQRIRERIENRITIEKLYEKRIKKRKISIFQVKCVGF